MKKLFFIFVLILSISVNAKEYTWNDVQKCSQDKDSLCNKEGVLLSGLLKSYDENGNLWIERNYRDGKTNGISKQYYKNGNLWTETSFKNNRWEGLRKIYYENGNLKSELNYKNGKEDGVEKE